ncbi:MAG: hypothetical protein WAK18_18750 [Nocardioidaceae bacterium]
MYLAGIDGLPDLAARQHGVVAKPQLRGLGVSYSLIDHQLDAHRWSMHAPGVIVLHNHVPTRQQWMWIALLDAGEYSALGSHTALELHGMRVFASEAAHIHLVIPRGAKVRQLPLVQIHESRRFGLADKQWRQGFPCLGPARSAVDAAAWQRSRRFAMTMMAAVVQQRLCTVAELDAALARCGRVRHKNYMRIALRDIAGGAESLGEIDVAELCRRFGLELPDRQVFRRDPSGRRRYLDCEWILADGTIVVLEIDGAHHLDVENWQADMRRERKIVTSRRFVLRATAAEVYLDPADVVGDLRALGVPTTRVVRTQ